MSENLIKPGDYVIVQRQNYTKLHKLKQHGTVTLGSFVVELDNIIGCKYFENFRMLLQPNSKKFYTVEKIEEVTTVSSLTVPSSGIDNRGITANTESQNLTKEEIMKLREDDLSSNEIVEKLIENSKTFAAKTEYSQEKYLKKKEKKYFDCIQIKKPTVRILAQMFYRQDPAKILGVRIDDLSQILTSSNVQCEGNYVLYDSGTSGLIAAAIMNAIGAKTAAKLIHVHPGNECQKQALLAMQFPQEQTERCVNVNLYSVLRCYYQNKRSYLTDGCQTNEANDSESVNSGTNEANDSTDVNCETNEANDSRNVNSETKDSNDDSNDLDDGKSEEPPTKKRRTAPNHDGNVQKPCWQYENERACRILHEKVDGLIIVAKDHPVNLVKELLVFLKGGRNVVVFSLVKEPLQDLYLYLKTRCDIINIRLSTNFMRNYQVLPERTHPEVNMNSGGFILSAFKLVT